MPAVHTALAVEAVDAALRQLPPSAECLLRKRFGIGAPAGRRRSARPRRSPLSLVPGRRLRQLEASAFRTLRLNALG